MTLSHRLVLPLSLLVALWNTAPTSHSRPRAETILYVSVHEPDGRLASGRDAQEFEVYVDSRLVPIVSVSTSDAVSAVLLVDISASMTWSRLEQALDLFVSRLRPGDRTRIVTVAADVWIGAAFTADGAVLSREGRTLLAKPMTARHGPSPVWDAMDTAIRLLSREESPRGIIALTDGRTTGNRVGMDEVIARANDASVSISVAADRDVATSIGRASQGYGEINPGWMLQELTAQTGGSFVSDPRPAGRESDRHPGPQLIRLHRDLQMTQAIRLSGSLGALPPSLIVKVKRPGLVVRHRGRAGG